MRVVGKPVVRIDALAKVTGQAVFARDMVLPGMLHMKLVFSGQPHASIESLGTRAARGHHGVEAVLTSNDVPNNIYGLEVADQPVLCSEVVRYVGDRLAAVVAVTSEIAKSAARLIKIKYQPLPILDDPLNAIRPGAPLVHADSPGNIAHSIRVRKGDVKTALEEADVVVKREYHTPMQEHAFLEPEAGLAYIDEQDRVVVHTAGQNAHEDQRQIAEALRLPIDQIRVIYGPIGGAFGGREDVSVQILVALAAWRLRRPVKIEWTRAESIIGHPKRHAMILRHEWGARRDGMLVAAKVDVISDAGAYASTTRSVLEKFTYAATGPYNIPNVWIDARAVFTNNIPGGAFRGYGSPQATFGAELQIAHLADELGIDPITFRLRNCLRDGSILPTQSPVPVGVSLPDLIVACAHEAGAIKMEDSWQMPVLASTTSSKRRGWGFAVGMKNSGIGFGFPEGSEARVVLYGDTEIKRAEVHTSISEVGQGAHSALAQIAAEALEIDFDLIEMVMSDTSEIGEAGFASASRVTLVVGNAVLGAARKALKQWQNEVRPAVAEYRWDAPRTSRPDLETGACVPSFSFSYGAQAAEMEVDLETGETRLLRVVAAHDPGQAVNPEQVIGQIHGGVIQAQGWSLIEDFVTAGGRIVSDQLSTYLIPTVMDIPECLDCVLVEQPDPVGPFGVRGVGEIPFVPLAPAIVTALHDALGVWFDSIPLTAEKVWSGLRQLGLHYDDKQA